MNNANIPNWARKPYHPKKVVATKQGWVVEETGEILVRVRNLDEKLAEYLGVQSVAFDNGMVVASNPVSAPEATMPLVVENQPDVIPLAEAPVVSPIDASTVVEPLPTTQDELTLEKPNEGQVADTVAPVKRKPGRPRKDEKKDA